MVKNSNVIEELRTLYGTDSAFKAVCDDFAGREKCSWRSAVDRTSQRTGLPRGEIVRVFKRLAEIQGIGQFVVGRRGAPSRFEWNQSSLSVGRAAGGEVSELEERPASSQDVEQDDADLLVTHRFRLRSDVEIELRLPANFQKGEAERLADYVKTLPLG
jgi:hypothetical protein